MGFAVESDVYKLIFVEPEFEGLEVRARSVSIRDLVRISALSDVKVSPFLPQEEWDKVREIAEIFAKAIVSWNLEIDGEPVPVSADGLLSLPLKTFWKIQASWVIAIAGVSDPLPEDSNGGNPSLEESMPMETLSENQKS